MTNERRQRNPLLRQTRDDLKALYSEQSRQIIAGLREEIDLAAVQMGGDDAAFMAAAREASPHAPAWDPETHAARLRSRVWQVTQDDSAELATLKSSFIQQGGMPEELEIIQLDCRIKPVAQKLENAWHYATWYGVPDDFSEARACELKVLDGLRVMMRDIIVKKETAIGEMLDAKEFVVHFGQTQPHPKTPYDDLNHCRFNCRVPKTTLSEVFLDPNRLDGAVGTIVAGQFVSPIAR